MPNVVRIAPPLDLDALVPATPPSELERELELGPMAMLYPGHFGKGSGISEAIEAFAALPHEYDAAVLVLACRAHPWQDRAAEEREALRAAAAASVAHRVRLLRTVRDMPALISACAFTVLVPRTAATRWTCRWSSWNRCSSSVPSTSVKSLP